MSKLPPKNCGTPRVAWLRREWHSIPLILAVLFLSVTYLPQVLLWGLNSDIMIPAIFYQDLTQGGHIRDWWWGGASFIFPDLTFSFVFNYLLGDGISAIQATSGLFYLLWFVFIVAGYATSGFRNIDVFAACVALLGTAMVWTWSLPWGFATAFFLPVDHGGGYVVALGLLAGVQYLWRQGWKGPLGLSLIGIFTFLITASDSLTITILTGPVMATMLLAAFWFPSKRRRALILAGTVGGSTIAGYLLAGVLFPAHLKTGSYTGFHLDLMLMALSRLGDNFDFARNGPIGFLFLADAILFVGAIWALWLSWNRSSRTQISPTCFFILAYTVGLLALNWGAVIVTGSYAGRETTRYVALSLFWPLLLLAGWLSASINWRRWMRQLFAVVVSGLCLAIGLYPPDSPDYHDRLHWVPEFAALLKQENTTTLLGSYWCSNSLTVLSKGTVTIRNLTKDGQLNPWFANEAWFRAEPPGGFRLILMSSLDPALIRDRFGPPQRITTVAGLEVWIYAAEGAIHYLPEFKALGNRHTYSSVYRTAAPHITHQTGVVEGGSLVARPTRDASGTVADGPDIHPLPGRYRVEFTYAYLSPAKKGLEPIFDAVLVDHDDPVVLTSEPLPQSGTGTQTAAQEFTIPNGAPGQLQCRIQYRGSGTIRVDSQTITRLGS